MTIELAVSAILAMALSGAPGLLLPRRSTAGQWIATLLMGAGGVAGAIAAAGVLATGQAAALDLPWLLPWGRFSLLLDALSAVFLLPVFALPALGSVYGMSYWPAAQHLENGRKLRLFYGLLASSMAILVLAQDAVLFLVAWEAMAIAAFFLIGTEDGDAAARAAAWVYLVAAHLGTLCLLPMFGLLAAANGSFAIEPVSAGAIGDAAATAVFVLGLVGFGLKAGVVPLHVWLPAAHAAAPSHVSAVLSGVMIKMGVYGLLRILAVLPETPPWWGALLLALGGASGLAGIAYAIGQRDLKRALAYSSIENIGIVIMGVGLAVLGRATSQPVLTALGLGGALLHVWNHSLFKGLLFLGAGSVVHATGTRDLERLGGLSRSMPRTSKLFVIGAVAICGLPPLNGFVGEFVIYLGLLDTLSAEPLAPWRWAACAVPVLAIIGGLTVLCFVRIYGAVFLGTPRGAPPVNPHEAGSAMIAPMALLAAGCAAIGLWPALVLAPRGRAVEAWSSAAEVLPALVPTTWISATGGTLAAAALLAVAVAARRCRSNREASAVGTWDCGFAAPTSRIQYTASSFGQFVGALSRWALWPRRDASSASGPFPGPSRFRLDVPDLVLDRAVLPVFRVASTILPWVRLLQQGRVQIYVLYILAMVLVLLMWS